MKSLQEQAWEIMNNFDFEYLQLFMSSNIARPVYADNISKFIGTKNWKILTKNGFEVPTVEELKDGALNLINKLIEEHSKENYCSISTGPFKVSIIGGRLYLETILIDWYYDGDDIE